MKESLKRPLPTCSLTIEYPNPAYRAESGSAPTFQPKFSPLFCSFNQVNKGAKYSTIALASALSSPVIAFKASGQGFD